MTYRPRETVFGPPLTARLPSLVYLAVALGVGLLVVAGEHSGSNSWLFNYVVVADHRRPMSIRTLSVILFVSALAAVLRAGMRGVRIYPDGVEARDVLNMVVPKLRRYRWPQIEAIVLDQRTSIALDLWDGSRVFLPTVSDAAGLVAALQTVAEARAIPVQGAPATDEVIEDEEGDPADE